RPDTTWSSSNPAVATVDNIGNVKAVSEGVATITANTGGYLVKAEITVLNPYISYKSLKLYRKKAATLKVMGAYGNVQWVSSNPKVATVSSKGVVTGKGIGTAVITAKASGENLACKVVVKGPEISAKSKTLYTGNVYALKVNGALGKVKWKSSKPKVAKISSKGTVTALKKGSTTITAKVEGKTYKCKIKVNNNQKSFKVNKNVYDYDYGAPEVVLSKVYFSKGKLKMDLYVMNNRIFKATKFTYIKYWLYDNNDRLIAYQKFKNVKLNIKPRKYKKITLTFSNKNVKNKNVILNKGVYDDWDYYYRYDY
ncbi:MAG: Ig-like domain-containing protein, partial [Firmicutes bacterium]|nr:Ig-like domain-containing protein [Bacillota bacterium]